MATVVKFTEPNKFGDVAVILTNKEFFVLQEYMHHSNSVCHRSEYTERLGKHSEELYTLWEQLR